MTPLLALTMPYGQAMVLGTSLLSMIPPSVAALIQHNRQALRLGLCSTVCQPACAQGQCTARVPWVLHCKLSSAALGPSFASASW